MGEGRLGLQGLARDFRLLQEQMESGKKFEQGIFISDLQAH